MADENLINQDEINNLLNKVGTDPAPAADGPAAQAPSDAPPSPPPATPQPIASGDQDVKLAQNDIEALFNQTSQANQPAPSPSPRPAARPAVAAQPPAESSISQGDVDFLLNQAERALASIDGETGELPQGVTAFRFEEFRSAPASSEAATFDLIRDVELDLKIELGRTHMYLEDVLKLRRGSVVPLDKLAGDPVDIYVNGRMIAKGEVLVLNDNFCVRVAELIAGTKVCA
jgi:flagellar motor switch protein FliN